jgi:SAM-dependent methyltransferase
MKRFYDLHAGEYDGVMAKNGWGGYAVLGAALRDLVEPPRRVLELGGGTGLATRVITETMRPTHFTVVEPSGSMIDCLRTRFGDYSGMIAVQATAEEYLAGMSECETYDLTAMIGVAAFLAQPSVVCHGISRSLTRLGTAMLTYEPWQDGHSMQGKALEVYEEDGHPFSIHRYTPEEAEAWITEARLRVVSNVGFQSHENGDATIRTQFVVAQPQVDA